MPKGVGVKGIVDLFDLDSSKRYRRAWADSRATNLTSLDLSLQHYQMFGTLESSPIRSLIRSLPPHPIQKPIG